MIADKLLSPDGPLLWMLIVAILLLCYLVWFILARRFDLAKPEYIIGAMEKPEQMEKPDQGDRSDQSVTIGDAPKKVSSWH